MLALEKQRTRGGVASASATTAACREGGGDVKSRTASTSVGLSGARASAVPGSSPRWSSPIRRFAVNMNEGSGSEGSRFLPLSEVGTSTVKE